MDLKQGTVRLQPGRTRNKEGRLVYLPAEALAVLREQERKTRAVEQKEQRLIPWVFPYRGERVAEASLAITARAVHLDLSSAPV